MSEQQVTPSLRPLLAVAFLAATTMAVAGPGMPAWASDRDGDIVSRTEEGGGLVPLSDSELIYVRHDATGANDGSSWEDAFTTLQAALDAAGFDDEIWVAAGTYKPTHDYGLDIGPRGRHFRLRNTVEIYGGFAGTETAREQRDWQANLTVLSGDIGVEGDTSDNCYHVFFHPSEAPYVNDTAVLDGFAITGGNADGDWPHSGGGGMFNHASSPSVANCTFSGNSAGRGGGMYNYNFSDANIVNSTFSGNTATEVGGGTYNYQSAPTVTNGAFSGNEANSGGGMANLNFSSPTVTNCIFSENSTDAGDGGGMYNTRSDATVTESTFSGNSAGERGGAMHNSSCSPTVTNCAFTDNSAATYGGAMFNYEAGPGVTNCTFSGNEANSGGGMHNAWVSSPSITNCTFTRNAATNGPALACHSEGSEQPSSVTVLNSIVYDGMDAIWNGDESKITINHSAVPPGWSGKENIHENPRFVDAEAGNLRLQAISPCIDAGNNSHLPEGVTTDLDGNPRIVNRTVDMGAYEFQGQSSHLIAGLNDAGGIFRREGVTAGAPAGTDWDRIPGFLTQLSAGTGALWGVNENGGVFVRTGITPDTPNGTAWERADGTLAQVSAGESGVVWGLNASGGIFVREGVTDGNPTGTGWDRVPGRLAHVAAGVGSVWGLNEAGGIFVRTGVTGDTPKGTAWEQVPGRLADVSVGDTGLVWGLNEAGGIFVRTGVTADEPAGTGWDRVPGRLSQVTAGFDVVWGLNENGGIFAREGVTADTPEGSDWSRVAGTLAQVTAGLLEPQTTSLEVKDTADGDSKTLTESTLSTSPSRDA
ncbi:MAG: tectonin domain-containing protein, partial [Candidatus Brocadiia bacterium]